MDFSIEYKEAPNYVRIWFSGFLFKKDENGKSLQGALVLDSPGDLERLHASHDKIEIRDYLDLEKFFSFLQALLAIPGIVTITVNNNWISLARHTSVPWEDIIPKVESICQAL